MKISREGFDWLEELFSERYGIKTQIIEEKAKSRIKLLINNETKIYFAQEKNKVDFEKLEGSCEYWNFKNEQFNHTKKKSIPLPGIQTAIYPIVQYHTKTITLNYDVISFIYWNLTRIEEVNDKKLDIHYRNLGRNSYAYKNNYLYRPIVDEWILIIKELIYKKNPKLKFKENLFKLEPTHDIDLPFKYLYATKREIFRTFLSDFIKRKKIKKAFNSLYQSIKINLGEIKLDPYNNYSRLMDISEQFNTRSIFFFQVNQSNKDFDGNINLNNLYIKNILREIYKRNHNIGIHPSYEAYNNKELLWQETKNLQEILNSFGIDKQIRVSRMHYLRWDHRYSLDALENANLNFDSTLGYADTGGFRCGTCFKYRFFDHYKNKKRDIYLKPLILMESTLFSSNYLNLSYEDSNNFITNIKNECKEVGGNFLFLWHNSSLNNIDEWKTYKNIFKDL
ncbi:polysaccharide deacetylase family protein [Prochlorococcus marinus]|uniref:DUF7033 domain-containing protein n=1 Tax=Prochlorococcus marinus str. GP2 TaxID=59925 RepID=A0A0A1ZAK2_PROMR|nr:polysaccharide deacetylase family protein [Prochlorococcus marinus]KGF86490.1 hypothetical protein EU91_1252 [Prochlorococcus marinus str. GP2]